MADDFVDVYFPDDPNYVFGDLGTPFCGTGLEDYEAAETILSDAEIGEAIAYMDANPGAGLDYLVRRIYNQKQEGSCVGNASTHGVEVVGTKQVGKDRFPELSAISCYKQIGRSAGSGAMVSDAMVALRDVGVLPLDTPKNREKFGQHVMPPTGFSTKFPDGWKDTAKLFRGVEFLVIKSVRAMFTALCKGHPVIVGREGHSILYLRPLADWKMKYANSWGSWGTSGGTLQTGFGIDTARQVEKSGNWAYAIRSVTIPDNVLLVA